MLYRKMETTGDNLSILGYGCMRFPQKNGAIDEEKVRRQITYAIDQGVNYFDTAYIYPGSEKALGKILSGGLREKVKIATKLPVIFIKSRKDMDKIFQTQLNRLQTGYIDYYLIHNLNSLKEWNNLKYLGVEDFIRKERSSGKIINIGFSYHGNRGDFKAILDDYKWDFCQIQYNYMDVNYQAGKQGLIYAYEKGVPVIVMEPLRGGTLSAKLPPKAEKYVNQTSKTPAELALKWIWNHKEVTLLLSGMNVDEHIAENIKAANESYADSLSDDDFRAIETIKQIFAENTKTPCTGCGYCVPCPAGVNIPFCFSMNNAKSMFGGFFPIFQYLTVSEKENSRASRCSGCGKCERHCPQKIEIRKHLSGVVSNLEKIHYRVLISIAYKFRNMIAKR